MKVTMAKELFDKLEANYMKKNYGTSLRQNI